VSEGAVHVHLTHDPGLEWLFPECGKNCPLYDHQPERRWRHLDTCQYRTILHAAPLRSNCQEHGVISQQNQLQNRYPRVLSAFTNPANSQKTKSENGPQSHFN
jgi:hypothetical protein